MFHHSAVRAGVALSLASFDIVTSTMDVARSLINHQSPLSSVVDAAESSVKEASAVALHAAANGKPFGVQAKQQMKGRGTNARQWLSPAGNLYFTLCIPMPSIPPEVLPVFPLIVGLAVHGALTKAAQISPSSAAQIGRDGLSCPPIRTKWPNDIVWNGRKLSGMLIENEGDYVLIGIGCNLTVSPVVNDGGRTSVCLSEIMQACNSSRAVGPNCREVACDIHSELTALLAWSKGANDVDAIQTADPKQVRLAVVQRFGAALDWSLPVRRRPEDQSNPDAGASQRSAATVLKAVRLNEWGHLVVRPFDPSEGLEEETLFSQYLI